MSFQGIRISIYIIIYLRVSVLHYCALYFVFLTQVMKYNYVTDNVEMFNSFGNILKNTYTILEMITVVVNFVCI